MVRLRSSLPIYTKPNSTARLLVTVRRVWRVWRVWRVRRVWRVLHDVRAKEERKGYRLPKQREDLSYPVPVKGHVLVGGVVHRLLTKVCTSGHQSVLFAHTQQQQVRKLGNVTLSVYAMTVIPLRPRARAARRRADSDSCRCWVC